MSYLSSDDQMIPAIDGTTLFLRHWRPNPDNAKPKAVVQLVHGLAEHSARYTRFAEQLVQQGFHVYAHDHRGHGSTAPSKAELGFFAEDKGWSKVVNDLKSVNERIRSEWPTTPLILIGHSMGSFVTQSALIQFPKLAEAVILSGSTVPSTFLLKSARWFAQCDKARHGPMTRCRIVDFLTFKPYNLAFRPNRTESDWLTRDPEEVDLYIQDPYCGFVATAQMWIDLSDGMLSLYRTKTHSKLPSHIPYLLIAGDKDPVGDKGKGVKKLGKRLKKYGATTEIKLYQDGRHEMLNEVNRDEVMLDIINWIHQFLNNGTAHKKRSISAH